MRLLPLFAWVAACSAPPAVALAPTAVDDGGVTIDLASSPDLASVTRDAAVVAPRDLAAEPPDLTAMVVDLSSAPDLASSPDLATPPAVDLAAADAYTPPVGDDSPVAHAPPSTMSGAATLLAGQDVLDVSTDQGGGVWAVTAARVYYLAPGGAVYTYDQSSGLARGWSTWTDTWFGFATAPVTFRSVAGGISGEAVIGNIGAIADRLQVNPGNGGVTRIDNMKVVVDASDPVIRQEQEEQTRRVVASWRVIADLNGTFDGTAYLGGFHGMYAFHGLDADCGCQAFQQHNHAFAAFAEGGIAGGDVRALALSPDGDVWQGDRDVVALWPQRSLGPRTDFFQNTSAVVDVFPGVRDEVWGLGVDAGNGVYVASYGNGLAYLSPASHLPSEYWSRATNLPQNHLTDVTVDASGDVWIATPDGGAARLQPGSNSWSYYTAASGLASNNVHRVYFDKYKSGRTLYFATANGVTVYRP